MQPDTGGRYDLRLRAQDANATAYELTLSTGGSEWATEVAISLEDGAVGCGAWRGDGEPPAWLFQYARAALRSAWHAHRELGWPRRLTRWRDVPARSSAAGRESRDE